MHFNDENTLDDILGCLYVARADFPDVNRERKVDQLIARIEAQLVKSKNRIRHNWFSKALEFALQARDCFASGEIERGRSFLDQTEEYLVSGNKAHRRKTAFLVDESGAAHPVEESK